jgi:UDP-N-acetylglucosamine--N-acetylmuramyl-(pentapeptide) pyrophosphoryl-undecaprenol N-acetylglucosamine transferase
LHDSSRKTGPKLCLAGSGGGHLRQLLDLEPIWGNRDHFFVTEASGIAEDLAKQNRVYTVRHYAAGQARLGKPIAMLAGAAMNFFQSARIVLRERPDVIISTGAGAMFWTALLGRIMGAKFILIDSFARFDAPSKFAKLAKPFASHVVIQSAAMAKKWPDALLFDPLKILERERPIKSQTIFATVGATLPFDRMSRAVRDLKLAGQLQGNVILQIGIGSAIDANRESVPGLRIVETLPFQDVQEILKTADIVICHGGTGSFITALREGCRVIAMPRLAERGEHYDNHQFEISTAFAARGLVEVALESDDIIPAIVRAKSKTPPMATTDPAALITWLNAQIS